MLVTGSAPDDRAAGFAGSAAGFANRAAEFADRRFARPTFP